MTNMLPIVTALLCVVSFVLLVIDTKNNLKNDENEHDIVFSKSMIIYSIVMIFITIASSALFCTLYKDNNLFTSLKRLSLLSVMWPIAYIDIKSYRIPNIFIVFGILCRFVILPFEIIFDSNVVLMTFVSDFIAAAALLIAAFLCSICIKNSIGYGDIKMFIVMGLLLGLNGIWSAIFLSLIVSFIVSLYLLIKKIKTRKDAIPFGPALVIGTFLSVCLSGM